MSCFQKRVGVTRACEEFEVCNTCLSGWVQTGHCMALNSKAQLGLQREDMFACLAPWLLLA